MIPREAYFASSPMDFDFPKQWKNLSKVWVVEIWRDDKGNLRATYIDSTGRYSESDITYIRDAENFNRALPDIAKKWESKNNDSRD